MTGLGWSNEQTLFPSTSHTHLPYINNPIKSDSNHFGAEGFFEWDLGDSEIPLTPKQEREQKLLEEQLKKKEKELFF